MNDSQGKMVKVALTADAEINRKALPQEVLDTVERLKNAGIPVTLSGYWVKQGSEEAERVSQAHKEYAEKHPDV